MRAESAILDAAVAVFAALFVLSLAFGGPPRFIAPWAALFALSAAVFARLWIEHRRLGRDVWRARPDAALFWLCLTCYLASFRWHGGDDIPNSMLGFQIWRHGTLAFDEVRAWATAPGMGDLILRVRGRLVSFYPISPGVLAAPLYAIPAMFVRAPSDQFLHNLSKCSGAVMTAASVPVFYRVASKRCSPQWALQCSLLYGLGSFAFSVSSQALYSHGPAQLGIILGLLGLLGETDAWAVAAGFGFALAWTAREDAALFGAAAAAYFLFHQRRRLASFAAGGAGPAVLNLAYWHHYCGAFHPPYYAIQAGLFTRLDPRALIAMLISPFRGLLVFFPAALFGAWGLARARRDARARWELYFAAACAATWLLFSMRSSWTAGNSFGQRYFSVVAMVLALFCAEVEDAVRRSARVRSAWSAVFAYCVLVHAIGALFRWPGYRMTLDRQAAVVWHIRMFPLVFAFVDGGAIGAVPWPWRLPYGLFLMSLITGAAWSWSRARVPEGVASEAL